MLRSEGPLATGSPMTCSGTSFMSSIHMVLPAKLLDHFLWSNKSNINPMYVQHVFSVLFTRVLNTIACVCRRGVSGLFSAGLWLAFVSSVRDSFGRGKCLSIFYRGLMCMCCVCVCWTCTHTAFGVLRCEPGCRDETPGEPGRNPDVLY